MTARQLHGKARGIALHYLSEWRQAKFLTQRELAEESKVSQTSIARLETGANAARMATIKKLALALRITSDQLVDGPPKAKATASDANASGHASDRAALTSDAVAAPTA